MLYSIALIILVGMAAGWLCKKVKLPALLGMVLTGIVLGPHVLNQIDESILLISADLRKIALIIILARAGLTLDVSDLKKVGRPALLMCFVPAVFEITGSIILAPMVLNVTRIEAAVIGSVLAAVSPAVVVPKMIKLIDEKYGTREGIPQLILAGASVDDATVIVMFTAFTSLASGGKVSVISFVNIPVSIILGILIGLLAGFQLSEFYERFHMRDTVKVAVMLSVCFLLVTFEAMIKIPITFAALISVMAMGIALSRRKKEVAKKVAVKLNQLWVVFEVMLFVLVGATVDISYVKKAGIATVVMIFGALVFRMLGVAVSLLHTKLNLKEKLFCALAYTPKATVQAAIGGVPLAMGLSCGNLVLTAAVLAILITAPLGAFMIDLTYKTFLKKE